MPLIQTCGDIVGRGIRIWLAGVPTAVDPGGIVGATLGATPAAGVPGRVPSVAEVVPVPGPLIGLVPEAAGVAVCGHPGMLGKDTCVAMAVVRAFNMDVS